VALEVAPATAIGIRRGGPRASTERWFGPLLRPPRAPERPAGTGLDHELLLRVDISPEAGVSPVPALRGRRAARAQRGRRIATRTIAVGKGGVRTVRVVALGGAVAVDVFDGRRRLARAPVPGADGRGQLVAFRGEAGAVRVRWRNPDGKERSSRFTVTSNGLR
jgi:hypothetical protein